MNDGQVNSQEIRFAKIAEEKGFLKPEEIEKCWQIQRQSTQPKSLGQTAVEMGFLQSEQIDECLKIQKSIASHRPFGEIALDLGHLSPEQLDKCVQVQQRQLEQQSFSKICLDQEFLTEDQVDEILAFQGKGDADSQIIKEGLELLIIDNSSIICHFFKVALSKAYIVTFVTNGKEALQLIRNPQKPAFDLVILEMTLQGIDGLEIAEIVRKIPKYGRTPILFLTSFSSQPMKNVMQKVEEVGGVGILAKADIKSMEELQDTIQSYIEVKG